MKNKNQQAGDAVSLAYQCALPLSTRTVQYVTDLLRKHLQAIRSRWRALTDERGRLIWISAARPGRTHDITAARHDHIVEHLKAAGRGALADLGFLGLDKDCNDQVVVTGYKATRARKLTTGQKTADRIIAAGSQRSRPAPYFHKL